MEIKVTIGEVEQTFENRKDAVHFLNNSLQLYDLPVGAMFKYKEKWYVKMNIGGGLCTCVQVLPSTKRDLCVLNVVEVE